MKYVQNLRLRKPKKHHDAQSVICSSLDRLPCEAAFYWQFFSYQAS
jgi:hypothetical protein